MVKSSHIQSHLVAVKSGFGSLEGLLSGLFETLALLPLVLAPLACWRTAPLPTKESLTGWTVVLILALWGALRLGWRKYRWRASPVDLPLLLLWIIAGLSLLIHTDAWFLRLRDFILLTVFLAYAKTLAVLLVHPRIRSRALHLVILTISLVAAVALLMERGIYFFVFRPIELPMEQGRHTVASTIGHNGSVADLMLAGLFYIFAFMILSGRTSVRIMGSVLILLHVYIIVAARTVAVWLLLPPLVILLGIGLLGSSRHPMYSRLWRKWALFAVGGILLLAFLVWMGMTLAAPDYKSTPAARLERLRPSVFMKGTRTRLWRVGLDMIRLNPLGMGLGGFKYRYPEYQGDYFERYPDSRLVPTSLHPDRAHNEYLQVAIELGIPGMIIAFWLILAWIAWVFTLWKRSEGRARAMLLCVCIAMAATALHSLVNFKFHVISSATIFLFGFAWLNSFQPMRREISFWKMISHKQARFWAAGGLLIAMALQVYFGIGFQVEELFVRGHYHRRLAFETGKSRNVHRQYELYRQAAADLQSGYALAPHRGDLAYYAGVCLMEAGRLLCQASQWKPAWEALDKALDSFRRSERTFLHLEIYRDKAETYLLKGQVAQAIGQEGQSRLFFDLAEESLRHARWMNPRDLRLAYLQGQFYILAGNREKAMQIWKEAAESLPYFLDEQVLAEAQRYLQEGRRWDAWEQYQLALKLMPHHEQSLEQARDLSFRLGQEQQELIFSQIREAVEKQPDSNPSFLLNLARYSIRKGDLNEANHFLDRFLEQRPRHPFALLLKTNLMLQEGRREEARMFLEERMARAVVIGDVNWELFIKMAELMRDQQGMPEAESFLESLTEDPRVEEGFNIHHQVELVRNSLRSRQDAGF